MPFKENLLKKIEIEALAAKVIDSIGPSQGDRKIDKEAMRRLFDISGYTHRREREMDVYLKNPQAQQGLMVFLDNELPMYDTTVADAVMRRNPLIKEMVSIGKIIKILNDKDVRISQREDTVERIRRECLANLDLSYTESDIAEITRDGVASLDSKYADGVIEVMTMFAELLGFGPVPKAFKLRHFNIVGGVKHGEAGEISFGPSVLYSLAHNDIKLIETSISNFDKAGIEYFQSVAKGEAEAAAEGAVVFYRLKEQVLQDRPKLEV